MELFEILDDMPRNQTIGDNMVRAYSIINNDKYKKIACSISGGADSDVMLDICTKCDKDKKIEYVWFDTGLEYQATKEHLKYLESKYNVEIKTCKAIKSIPISCREYGQPFISKQVSEFIKRLQKHDFKWEDKSFEELSHEYKKCDSALRWWCNEKGDGSRFGIIQNKWLKEFMILNPPTFKISNLCCNFAKKYVANKLLKENDYDLNIVGIRKFEGGIRAAAYKNCFDDNADSYDCYRPLFWYKDQDKMDYQTHFNVINSRCYTEYGLKRTGCAGCPFGRDFEQELQVINTYEPKLYKAVNSIFRESYEYTKKYREFIKGMNKKSK